MAPRAFRDLSRTKQMKMLHEANTQQAQIVSALLGLCEPLCKYWKAIEKETDDNVVLLGQKSEKEGEGPTVVLAVQLRMLDDMCSQLIIHLAGGKIENNNE